MVMCFYYITGCSFGENIPTTCSLSPQYINRHSKWARNEVKARVWIGDALYSVHGQNKHRHTRLKLTIHLNCFINRLSYITTQAQTDLWIVCWDIMVKVLDWQQFHSALSYSRYVFRCALFVTIWNTTFSREILPA